VPDFIQAHFEEAPRLDNVNVVGRMVVPYAAPAGEVTTPPSEGATRLRRLALTCKRIGREGWRICHPAWTYPRRWSAGAIRRVFRANCDIPARWRALKRLAIQAHDQDREHEFFAGEIRSARFATDWPLPWPVWKANAWLGFFRFWFGLFYGLTSNYGRSVARPALWWLGALAVAGMFNLGEHRGMAGNRAMAEFWGASWPSAYVTTSYDAWRWDRPCYVTQAQLGARREPSVEGPAQGGSDAPDLKQEVDALKREIARLKTRNGRPDIEVVGLSDKVRAGTNAAYEALQLALRDGFLILYGDADTAHRIYGCLYGVELYGGGTPVAVVPAQVATASAIHKIWSAIMIFLFGLALRNMLKMK
jgi:hypothetical protein